MPLFNTCHSGWVVSWSQSHLGFWGADVPCKDTCWSPLTKKGDGEAGKKGGVGRGFDEVNELPCLILQVFTEQTAHTGFFFRLNWLESGWHAKLRTLTGAVRRSKWQRKVTVKLYLREINRLSTSLALVLGRMSGRMEGGAGRKAARM